MILSLDSGKSGTTQGPFVSKTEQIRSRRTVLQTKKKFCMPSSQLMGYSVVKTSLRTERRQEFLLLGVIVTVKICQGNLGKTKKSKAP